MTPACAPGVAFCATGDQPASRRRQACHADRHRGVYLDGAAGVVYLGARVLGWGLVGAWLGILADFSVRATFFQLRFLSGK